ncbi:hypothetical protein COCSUDRAFT_54303 [Coccomyxa subellipsoidea C-169]|uniref:Uncharacterized protein n=1 Tax=Coccomyxa subellipsoidea (strain C-169) TaxID=574566 RepID=I0YPP1_COCSC|nr:hypothetical protein COCSUDRAFT_54303 [Coccomyxa subellipsoidea C-169]EIE20360.1 hypothetical protein COCSUDRAFT_54303 [Coccomyxa subellipsoidea C-169]|eukprot:XP_005644904.1 hypothetical protein COCSUDRAFT_54303 [Coccomyxa subellipsoidea C-169]
MLGAYEKMTVAASLVGAFAGGAAAGPLGVSVGAKSGALLVAAGAGICGAAQHCYAHGLPVASMGSSLSNMGAGLLSSVSRRDPKAPASAQQGSIDPALHTGQPTGGVLAARGDDADVTCMDRVSGAPASSSAEVATKAMQPASIWFPTLSGLGSSLRPRTDGKSAADVSKEPQATSGSTDSLPTSSSASQQLTPRRSQDADHT